MGGCCSWRTERRDVVKTVMKISSVQCNGNGRISGEVNCNAKEETGIAFSYSCSYYYYSQCNLLLGTAAAVALPENRADPPIHGCLVIDFLSCILHPCLAVWCNIYQRVPRRPNEENCAGSTPTKHEEEGDRGLKRQLIANVYIFICSFCGERCIL